MSISPFLSMTILTAQIDHTVPQSLHTRYPYLSSIPLAFLSSFWEPHQSPPSPRWARFSFSVAQPAFHSPVPFFSATGMACHAFVVARFPSRSPWSRFLRVATPTYRCIRYPNWRSAHDEQLGQTCCVQSYVRLIYVNSVSGNLVNSWDGTNWTYSMNLFSTTIITDTCGSPNVNWHVFQVDKRPRGLLDQLCWRFLQPCVDEHLILRSFCYLSSWLASVHLFGGVHG